ncbi:hypothetical protein ACOMHN_004303 [Nucella lapillus]
MGSVSTEDRGSQRLLPVCCGTGRGSDTGSLVHQFITTISKQEEDDPPCGVNQGTVLKSRLIGHCPIHKAAPPDGACPALGASAGDRCASLLSGPATWAGDTTQTPPGYHKDS